MQPIYVENNMEYTTTIKAIEISNNIDNILTHKIMKDIEGKCIGDGYIKRNSVRIINRGAGTLMMSQFNGTVQYNIKYTALICNPHEGDIIECKVENINKMGVMAFIDDIDSPMSILLAKQHHKDDSKFNNIKTNDIINIKIIGKRFEFGDNKISIIGILNNDIEEPSFTDVKTLKFSNRGSFKWLSPFNIANPFEYNGRKYISIEHAFNSSKNDDEDYKDLFTLDSTTYLGDLPSIAKKTGTKTNMNRLNKPLIDGWDINKISILEQIMIEFYKTNLDIKDSLNRTGNDILEYQDSNIFLGINKSGVGNNNFGKLQMKLRII